MGKSSETADVPDYTSTEQATQGAAEDVWLQATNTARANQQGVGGSLNWGYNPETGQWTQTTGLSDANQGIYDSLLSQAQNSANNFYTADYSNIPDMPTVGGYNQEVIDTMRALQDPTLQRTRSAKEAQLAAMGLGTGSGRAWNNEQYNLATGENNADLQAIMKGYEQGNTEFQQGMDIYNAAMDTETSKQQNSYNALAGLLGLSGNMENQQFGNYTSYGPYDSADYTAAAQNTYSGEQDAANASNADTSSTYSTIGTLATTAAIVF